MNLQPIADYDQSKWISRSSQIYDVLVTADNPARNDSAGMDHARCAALHNYLVVYAWLAEGFQPENLHKVAQNWFDRYGAEAEALRPLLSPSLAMFLTSILIPPFEHHAFLPLFFWARGVSQPNDLFDRHTAELYDQPDNSILTLYETGQAGAAGGGIMYLQGSHRAAVFMHMDDYGFALPVEDHSSLWHPLETVLSNWISLIRLGKVVAAPSESPALFGNERYGLWEWQPYAEAQVASYVDAWEKLCKVIEAEVCKVSDSTAAAAAD